MTSTADIELRSVVKFCVRLNLSPQETLKQIQNSETLPSCGKTFVYQWYGLFQDGRASVKDDNKLGRLTFTVTLENTNLVKELFDNDRRLGARDFR